MPLECRPDLVRKEANQPRDIVAFFGLRFVGGKYASVSDRRVE